MIHPKTQVLCTVLPLVCIALAACGDATGTQDGSRSFLLDVRVHVLQSDLDALNATLSDTEIRTLFDGANQIWDQADVAWRVTDIVREKALNAATFAAILDGNIPPSSGAIASIVPRGLLTDGAWDVFFIRSFGGIAGGIYFPEIPTVIAAEIDPTGVRDLTVSGPRILAHELGHSLSMVHVPCTAEGNLMAPGCPARDRTRLLDSQVTTARAQAARGGPFTGF